MQEPSAQELGAGSIGGLDAHQDALQAKAKQRLLDQARCFCLFPPYTSCINWHWLTRFGIRVACEQCPACSAGIHMRTRWI